ncbi:MAG: tandem-95 repeat protein, partial [Gemmataceae bacterium]
NGSDSFTYKASDGDLDSNVVTVSITVKAVNDAPVAQSAGFATMKNNSVTGQVTATDVDSPVLTYSQVAGPAHGTLSFLSDGSFTYNPTFNFFGSDSFTYQANDGSLDSNVATVTISVKATNEAPVAPNVSIQTDEDTVFEGKVVGTDADEDPLSYAVVAGPKHGTLVFQEDGTYSYKANANYNGTDLFNYKVSDGIVDSNIATVAITVNAVNDGPGVVVPSARSYVVNQDLDVPGISVSDIDLGTSPIQVTLGVGNGVLTLKSLTGLTFTAGDGLTNGTMTFSGLMGDVNSALAGLVYRANRDSAMADTLTVTVNDLGNTGSGGPLSASKTVNLAPTQNFIGLVADPGLAGKFSLVVQAGAGADTVTINPIGTSLKNYTVTIAGQPVQTVLNVTGRILVYGLEGNDSLQLGTVKIATLLDGGADNDLLVGGTAADVMIGGLGNDDLRGGLGNDRLTGGLGNDRLDGGLGTDRLVEAGDVNFTLKQGTTAINGSLVGLGTDVLVLNHIEQADLSGGDGDNLIDASGFIGRVWLSGGKGNDTLKGGKSANTLMGNEGNDNLVGSISRDLLIGGLGVDNLVGGGNEDVLIGGTTNHDANRVALDAIMLEWTQLIAYNTRVAHLLGTLAGGKNGAFRLNNTTVKADGSANTMTGQAGTDWFFAASLVDVLVDRATGERVTAVTE